MIISASRRTDIPAFYSEWFMNRIRAGYCEVVNPFNRKQVSQISLAPQDVDVIVFWTRNPRPLFPHLDELTDRGYRFYFQYTILDYPASMEHKTPPLEAALDTFQELAARIGKARLIWRYDPIIFSPVTDSAFHITTFQRTAARLRGCTTRTVISILDDYRKTAKRMRSLAAHDAAPEPLSPEHFPHGETIQQLSTIAGAHDLEIVSCAEAIDLTPYGVQPGKCVDEAFIERAFNLKLAAKKDPHQRGACGCIISRDIGAYNTCLFGCQYCYATSSFESARQNFKRHDPAAPQLQML